MYQLETPIDRWTYFIKHSEELHVIPDFANEDEGLKTAFIEADKYQWSKEELKAYDNVGIKEQDERGEKEIIAQKAMEKGEKMGREIGQEIGREIGREESTLAMVLAMYKEGFSMQQIAKVSKKSEQDITQILNNHTNK
jgi:predicted transposase YdaD